MHIQTLASVAALALVQGDDRFNLFMKEFVDDLSRPDNAAPERQRSMISDEPPLLARPALNAFLAGAAEFIAQRADVEAPLWTMRPERFLQKPVFWGLRPQMRAHLLAETPGPFRRRNLFCGYVWLRSSRWDGDV